MFDHFVGLVLKGLKSDFSSSFEELKDSINNKFSDINTCLDQMEYNIKRSVTQEVNESIMSIKNSIIDALKEENLKLQNKVKELEEKLSVLNEKSSNLDQ